MSPKAEACASLEQKFPALGAGTKLAADAVNRLAIPEYAD